MSWPPGDFDDYVPADDDEALQARVRAAITRLLDTGQVFRCGLCGHLVDASLTYAHASWHDQLPEPPPDPLPEPP
jgi:hypothetical protein